MFRVNYQKLCFSVPVTPFLTFLHFSQKCAEYVDPSGLSFMKFCVARTFWVKRHLDVVLQAKSIINYFRFSQFLNDLEIFLVFSLKSLLCLVVTPTLLPYYWPDH